MTHVCKRPLLLRVRSGTFAFQHVTAAGVANTDQVEKAARRLHQSTSALCMKGNKLQCCGVTIVLDLEFASAVTWIARAQNLMNPNDHHQNASASFTVPKLNLKR